MKCRGHGEERRGGERVGSLVDRYLKDPWTSGVVNDDTATRLFECMESCLEPSAMHHASRVQKPLV